jgi:Mrp family chromosome partitioning ATPase
MDKRDTIDPAVFDTARLLKLIDALRLSFDQIVIDFGSLSAMVDAAALSPVVDGYVCSAQWGLSDRKALAKTMANSGVPPEKIVGAIMGDVSEKDLSRYEAAV